MKRFKVTPEIIELQKKVLRGDKIAYVQFSAIVAKQNEMVLSGLISEKCWSMLAYDLILHTEVK
ncbi:hypothetical protein FACS189479_05630 [Spirochaetia bacterium]|nr:hypothetical protein FACS189479_05630 [Spirochaetia bacterium]